MGRGMQPKSIVIYNASWHTYGGGERYVCTLAESLSETRNYNVALLIDKPSVTKAALNRYFNIGLDRVTIKHVTRRQVTAELSVADIGVIVSNYRSFGNRAKKNVYILQIPYPKITGIRIAGKVLKGEVRDAGKDLFRRSLLKTAGRADLALVYSEFVKDVLLRSHNINSHVLYPAIDNFTQDIAKENIILSVGRFFKGLYNDKRYDFQIDAFKKLRERLPHTSWAYHLVGSCSADSPSQRYLEELRASATGHPVYFHVNSS